MDTVWADEYQPFAPDGTWQAPWPPEVWLVKHRVKALGYRVPKTPVLQAITARAHQGYVQRYGQEPPRRGRRHAPPTIVFEHARVCVLDAAIGEVLDAGRARL